MSARSGLAIQRQGSVSGCESTKWGERSILRATGQQCPRQKRRVTGPRVMPALQQQELLKAWNPESWVPELLAPHWKGFLVAQMVKNLPAMQETWIWELILPLGYSLYQSVAALTAFSGRIVSSSRVAKWYQVRTHWLISVSLCSLLFSISPALSSLPGTLSTFAFLLTSCSKLLSNHSFPDFWVGMCDHPAEVPFFLSQSLRAIFFLLHLCSSDDEVPGLEPVPQSPVATVVCGYTWYNWPKQNES